MGDVECFVQYIKSRDRRCRTRASALSTYSLVSLFWHLFVKFWFTHCLLLKSWILQNSFSSFSVPSCAACLLHFNLYPTRELMILRFRWLSLPMEEKRKISSLEAPWRTLFLVLVWDQNTLARSEQWHSFLQCYFFSKLQKPLTMLLLLLLLFSKLGVIVAVAQSPSVVKGSRHV